jgi:ABC-type lipoprotein export system ATPase subunit
MSALMARRRHSQGQTFFIVTHDPQVTAQTGRPVFFQDGGIVKEEWRE